MRTGIRCVSGILGDGFTMIVGPNAATIFLEVGYVEGDTAVVIVHAMRAREKFLR
jgi:hypothetical protein